METTKLDESQIAATLSKLPGWSLRDGKLHREYRFVNFVAAFSFMTSVAMVAHELNHHPEWFNVWNTVRVDLVTHDHGGVTSLDAKLAYAIEELAKRQMAK